jgi:hypothetical protein
LFFLKKNLTILDDLKVASFPWKNLFADVNGKRGPEPLQLKKCINRFAWQAGRNPGVNFFQYGYFVLRYCAVCVFV